METNQKHPHEITSELRRIVERWEAIRDNPALTGSPEHRVLSAVIDECKPVVIRLLGSLDNRGDLLVEHLKNVRSGTPSVDVPDNPNRPRRRIRSREQRYTGIYLDFLNAGFKVSDFPVKGKRLHHMRDGVSPLEMSGLAGPLSKKFSPHTRTGYSFIVSCCLGEQSNAYGYTWKFDDKAIREVMAD